MKRCDTPAVLHVVEERSLVALASRRIYSEAAKFVVDKFTCALLHQGLLERRWLEGILSLFQITKRKKSWKTPKQVMRTHRCISPSLFQMCRSLCPRVTTPRTSSIHPAWVRLHWALGRTDAAFAAVQEKSFVEISARDLVQAAVPVLPAARHPARARNCHSVEQGRGRAASYFPPFISP
jgi:hypothetical protein